MKGLIRDVLANKSCFYRSYVKTAYKELEAKNDRREFKPKIVEEANFEYVDYSPWASKSSQKSKRKGG